MMYRAVQQNKLHIYFLLYWGWEKCDFNYWIDRVHKQEMYVYVGGYMAPAYGFMEVYFWL